MTADSPQPPATAAVVICAYTERRWELLAAALASVATQTVAPAETILVIDHNDALLERAQREFQGVTVIANAHERGEAGVRNTSIDHATAEIIAFFDDDAVADPAWLERLLAAFAEPSTIGAGGALRPIWKAPRPRWFPDEFLWVVGCSHSGMPTTIEPVRNVIGANMAFRRTMLQEIGGFDDSLGRVGTVPIACTETELCIRATRHNPGSQIIYDPQAVVDHTVPAERTTLRYFLSRCRAEGISKAIVSRLAGSGPGLAAERTYTRVTLPRGVRRGLVAAMRGDVGGLGRAGAIVLGLAVTTFGYATEKLIPGGRR